MSTIRFDGGSSLREKREEFANEIRRAKRKEIFQNKRKILLQQYTINQNNKQTSQSSSMPFLQLLNLLQCNSQRQEQALQQLSLRLSQSGNNNLYMISQVIQTGKSSYLLQNLINNKFLKQTLTIISIIMSKNNYRHAHILVSKGIIQILLQLLPIEQYTGIVSNIISNICIQSDDYCEIILLNFKHQLIINVFNCIYQKMVNNQLKQNPQQTLKSIIYLMGVLVATKQSTLDFQSQYDAILFFCKDLMNRRILVKETISTVYDLAVKNSLRVEQVLSPVINQLLEQQTGQNQHLQDLLYLILKLTPNQHFHYNKLFPLIFISQYKIAKQIIYIINKLQDSECLNQLVRNQAWWERLLMKLDSNGQQFKIILSILRRLKITFPCVWRFVAQYIDDTYSKDIILQIILFLKNQLYAACQSLSQHSFTILQNIKKYKIPKALQKIFLKQKYQYSSKAEQLIFLIENLSNQLKHKYQIDVEI